LAQDTFRSYWENIGSYVDAQELNLEFVDLYSTYNLEAVDAIVDNITDSQQLSIAPFEWSNAIQSNLLQMRLCLIQRLRKLMLIRKSVK